jgi:uncharacterized protein (TIGR03086 family)
MTEISDRYETVANGFTRRLEGGASRLSNASPCDEWSARDVAVHVIGVHRNVLERLDNREAEPLSDDDDLIGAWRAASDAVTYALTDSERASTIISGRFAEQPFEQLVGRLLCADTLAHTWDFARATGQDEQLDPQAAKIALEFLTPLDDKMRNPGGFGPKVDPPPNADAQTAFLCFTGRRPNR